MSGNEENNTKWYQMKEQSAGVKRLILTWYLYKFFGERMLYFIAFLVSFFTLLFSEQVRNYSNEYLKIISDFTDIKPNIISQFKHIYAYANSLADKMLVYSGNYDVKNIVFEEINQKEELYNDINSKKGVFFICNHIGNIEIMQSLLLNRKENFKINIFLSKKQSKIFNGFLEKIKVEFPVKLYPIEDIGIDTGAELKESLDKGDVVFIAGDRLSESNTNKNEPYKMFSHNVYLPKGTFKLAKLMKVPVYYISAIKINKKYHIYIQKQNELKEDIMMREYIKFLEKSTLINPYQFFHFYKFFE